MFDGTLLALSAVVALLACVAYARGGGEMLRRGVADGGTMLYRYGLLIVVSFLAAGLVTAVLPHAWVRRSFGAESGFGGILLATAIGMVTPAGPFVSIPLAAAMVKSGAAAGPIVAFLAGWALLAIHRFVAWEVPMLGWRFAVLRYASCIALPPLAGLIARAATR